MPTITLKVAEDANGLNPSELADFLYLFRATTLALHKLVPLEDQRASCEPTSEQIEKYRVLLTRFSPRQLDTLFNPSTDPELLQIEEITRQSPLEIVYIGIPLLITLAVIFSGGKIKLNALGVRVEAQVKSLGDGVKSLRTALGLGTTMDAGYGIRSRVIKFTKEEYKALLLQAAETKNKGGFQRFLVGLQERVNRQTLKLEISEHDLERIYRWKANPRKGGWQSRFKKIFGRLFPDDHGTLPKQLK